MWISTTRSQPDFASGWASRFAEILLDCAEASGVWVKLAGESSNSPQAPHRTLRLRDHKLCMKILGVRLRRQIDLEAAAEWRLVKLPFVFLPRQEIIVENPAAMLRRWATHHVDAPDLEVGTSVIYRGDDQGAF